MRLLRPLILLACLIPAVASAQAVLDWAKDDGEGSNTYGPLSGTWSTAAASWVDDADFLSVGSPGVWVNGSIAYFVGPANSYTAAVGENLTLAGLKSGSPNLVIDNGGSYTLTLTGASPVFDVYYDSNVLNVPLAGTNGLTVMGGGGLTINIANPGLSGPVTIQNAIVHANNAGALGTGAITLGDATHGGRLDFNTPSGTGTFNYTLANAFTFANSSSALALNVDTGTWPQRTVTLTGPITLGAATTWSAGVDDGAVVQENNLVVTGVISETGGAQDLRLSGNVTLAGANTFSGNLHVGNAADGRLTIANFNNTGSAGPLGQGGSLILGSVYGSEGYDYFNGEVGYTGGTATSDRAINVVGNRGTIKVDTLATFLTLSGVISGSGGIGDADHDFEKSGPGRLILSGNNTYTGDTLLTGGALIAGSSTAFGVGAESTIEVGTESTNSSETLDLLLANGVTINQYVEVYNQNPGGYVRLGNYGTAGTATFAGDVYIQREVYLGPNSGGGLNFNGYVSDGSSGGSLVVDGQGFVNFKGGLDLSGGGLTINGGAKVTLSNPAGVYLAGGVTVNTNSTLALDPLSTGTLTVAHLTIDGGGLEWKLGDLTTNTLHDRFVVDTSEEGGNLSIAPGSKLTVDLSLLGISTPSNGNVALNNSFWQSEQVWKLIAFTGSGVNDLVPGNYSPLAVANGTFWAGGVFDTFVGGGAGAWAAFDAGDVYLRFTPVPEPSTYALLGAGLGLLGLRRLRRARS